MSRAIKRIAWVLCFAVIAFVAANIVYYRLCENYSLEGLNEAEQVDEKHSEINEAEIYGEMMLENSIERSKKQY